MQLKFRELSWFNLENKKLDQDCPLVDTYYITITPSESLIRAMPTFDVKQNRQS